jgi:hypothetical protein
MKQQTVTISACESHRGLFAITGQISPDCHVCGGPHGGIGSGFSFDGSCGHVDESQCIRAKITGALNINSEGMTFAALRASVGARAVLVRPVIDTMREQGAVIGAPGRNNSMIYTLRPGWDPKETTEKASE